MFKGRLSKLKKFPDNVEDGNAGLSTEGEEKFRFMNGRESMLNILINKEGE